MRLCCPTVLQQAPVSKSMRGRRADGFPRPISDDRKKEEADHGEHNCGPACCHSDIPMAEAHVVLSVQLSQACGDGYREDQHVVTMLTADWSVSSWLDLRLLQTASCPEADVTQEQL